MCFTWEVQGLVLLRHHNEDPTWHERAGEAWMT